MAAVAALAASVVVTGVVISSPPERASAAVTGTDIYVDNAASAHCSDTGSGSGTESQPFCTISAAAAVAQPGQTVTVEPGTYAPLTISVSGEPGNPITFQGATTAAATIEPTTKTNAIDISGAQNVVVTGFRVYQDAEPAYEVTGSSSDITINATDTIGGQAPDIEVDAASNVTISRSSLDGGTDVQVNPGASGVVVTGNTLIGNGRYATIAVTGASGTDVTGNTIVTQCGPAIGVSGGSAGASIENNIVTSFEAAPPSSVCTNADGTTAIAVAADSVAGTTSDYNLINPVPFTALYDWGGTTYPATAAGLTGFQGATGQGANDIAANPELGHQTLQMTWGVGYDVWWPLDSDSPAVDSANSGAPGELTTDQFGNPRQNDPNVSPKTGLASGGIYFDRGAVELSGGANIATGWNVVNSGPLTVTATQGFTPAWTANGPIGIFVYDFEDGSFPVVTTATSVQHTFPTAGPHTTTLSQAVGGANGYATASFFNVVGADYTPVTPDRVLDTRYGTGVAKAGAVPANGTLTLAMPSIDGVAAAGITAVVLNVTVTEPTEGGVLTVYPGAGTAPGTSNLNFSAGETVPNLVTVPLSGGEVSFHNTSRGSVQVIADLEGFYGPGGSGFAPQSPVRVLDTRYGTGAARAPVAGNSGIRLNLAGKVPTGTTAVVLNVTVTGPQDGGHLTVYPDSATVPNTSNLNFKARETVPNLVIVPLNMTNDTVDIENASPGTTQVVADLDGYFASGARDSFVPFGPAREEDTRTEPYGPVRPFATRPVLADSYSGCSPVCPGIVAVVENVTVTGPTRGGYLTVYPSGQARPVASNLNFTAGETVPNLVMAQPSDLAYNGSGGTLQFVVDEYGYFIASLTSLLPSPSAPQYPRDFLRRQSISRQETPGKARRTGERHDGHRPSGPRSRGRRAVRPRDVRGPGGQAVRQARAGRGGRHAARGGRGLRRLRGGPDGAAAVGSRPHGPAGHGHLHPAAGGPA